MSDAVWLGVGVLSWDRGERVSDRYGRVYVSPHSGGLAFTDTAKVPEPLADLTVASTAMSMDGKRGRLIARVLKTRQSQHIGDLFHGVGPVTPAVGECIVLGEGLFRWEMSAGDVPRVAVGIEPDDGRETLHMDIHALYRAHEQTVRLEFIPDNCVST